MKASLKGIILSLGLAAAPLSAEAIFSVEGYCVLSNENVSSNHLRAYAKKLGFTPADKVCRSFKQASDELKPKKWDYKGNKPYPGSVIKLTDKQIELLKEASKKKLTKKGAQSALFLLFDL